MDALIKKCIRIKESLYKDDKFRSHLEKTESRAAIWHLALDRMKYVSIDENALTGICLSLMGDATYLAEIRGEEFYPKPPVPVTNKGQCTEQLQKYIDLVLSEAVKTGIEIE